MRTLLPTGLGLALAACGGGVVAPADLAVAPPDLGPRSSLDDPGAVSARAACRFHAGDYPGASLPHGAPLGPEIPIDTIVVIVMENRSYDHLLGDLSTSGQPDAEGPPAGWSMPAPDGTPVPWHHAETLCTADTDHGWAGSNVEYDDGKNDGFARQNALPPGDPTGARALGYYTAAEVPTLHALANTYAIADRYFCPVLGPTLVNRYFLYAATSFGYTYNQPIYTPTDNLFESLERHGVSWKIYWETVPGAAGLTDTITKHLNDRLDRLAIFYAEAAQGALPSVSFIDPDLNGMQQGGEDDLHPPGDVQVGDAWIQKVVAALQASPQWPHMAIFLTFDEHGGFADHVPPPPACAPDDLPPIVQNGGTTPYHFDRYGFRVPFVLISPYARAHYVSHRVYDHTSIARFIEARHVLPALTARDANADPLYDLFDFGSPPRFVAAPALAAPTVDQDQLSACLARFPPRHGLP